MGLIALLGLDAETGVFMLLYLDIAYDRARKEGRLRSRDGLDQAILEGARRRRLRPKFMTFATTFIGLVPILWATGTGADVMKRIAAPMVGGLFTSFVVLELVVYPVSMTGLGRRQDRGQGDRRGGRGPRGAVSPRSGPGRSALTPRWRGGGLDSRPAPSTKNRTCGRIRSCSSMIRKRRPGWRRSRSARTSARVEPHGSPRTCRTSHAVPTTTPRPVCTPSTPRTRPTPSSWSRRRSTSPWVTCRYLGEVITPDGVVVHGPGYAYPA